MNLLDIQTKLASYLSVHIAAKGGSKLRLNLGFKYKYSQKASCKGKIYTNLKVGLNV